MPGNWIVKISTVPGKNIPSVKFFEIEIFIPFDSARRAESNGIKISTSKNLTLRMFLLGTVDMPKLCLNVEIKLNVPSKARHGLSTPLTST